MSEIKKHVGKIKSTEQRCVVVMMQIPGNETHALVINIESLTPRFEQMLVEVVDSAEGQSENVLADAMNRRIVPETGRSVLIEYHNNGLMRAEPIDNIVMIPRPNTPFELRDIVNQLAAIQNPPGTPDLAQYQTEASHNHHVANLTADSTNEQMSMANNFLVEAALLEEEAQKKRELAYQYAPSLRPKKETFRAVAEKKEVVEKPKRAKKTATNV